MSLPDRRDLSLDLSLDISLDLVRPLPGLVASVRTELPQADVEMVDMAEYLQAEADFELVPKDVPPTPLGAPAPVRPSGIEAPAWEIASSTGHDTRSPIALRSVQPERPAVELPKPTVEEADAAVTAALLESERLDEAEAALAAADAAVRDAEQALQRLRRAQSEQRLRTDAQRGRTIQARLTARTASLRHTGLGAPAAGVQADAQAIPAGGVPADAHGFQPTFPLGDSEDSRAVLRQASILTILPTQRGNWQDAANRPRMGKVLVEGQRLTPVDVEMVLLHQTTQQRRFGEIAVALGLLEVADVVWALRHQQPADDADPDAGRRPEGDMLVLRDDPGGASARVIRDIAGQVVERSRCAPVRQALAIVSPSVGDGKSTLAANLAMALAERGRRVLLVDTDLEGSRIHRMLPGLPASRGVAGVVRREQRLAEAIVQPQAWRSADPRHGFHLLPAAEPGAVQPLGSADVARNPRYVQMVERAVRHYDHVLLDAPAASRGAATRRLARLAGTAMVVARPGHTPNASLDSLTLELRRAGAAVLGVVMNSH